MEIRIETRERHVTVVTIANEARCNAMTRAMNLAEVILRSLGPLMTAVPA